MHYLFKKYFKRPKEFYYKFTEEQSPGKELEMKRNERKMIDFLKSNKCIDTYTVAKLREALGGENSMSKPSQQLLTTKPTDA